MLRISDNKRFIVNGDGAPFFYLADTAWELLNRLDKDEVEFYFQDRVRKKFTVIQFVLLVEHGFEQANRYGHLALQDGDPLRPNEDYFAYADWAISRANELGLTVAVLPTWGDKWNQAWGKGPEIFTPDNSFAYGEWLGRRYRDSELIWILGGDRHIQTPQHLEIIRQLAAGLTKGDGGSHLRTFHPPGPHSSAQWLHNEDWLDFNLWQTGHDRNRDTYNAIATDYSLTPAKPCLDSEPGYEGHPISFNPANGYLNDYDVRKAVYGSVFAGGCGVTYGCHDIWQFLDTSRSPAISYALTPWKEAVNLPGAAQMQHLRALIESRPYLSRIPDQTLLASDPGVAGDHVTATLDSDGRYAFIYSAAGKPFAVDMTRLASPDINLFWYCPRTGVSKSAGKSPIQNVKEFVPPTSGNNNDWVLVLDDATCSFPDPGSTV